ncbi:MAG: hypothetical protein ACI9OJ_000753 [Myxococcota bacterium]|jgi:hypothetical protein
MNIPSEVASHLANDYAGDMNRYTLLMLAVSVFSGCATCPTPAGSAATPTLTLASTDVLQPLEVTPCNDLQDLLANVVSPAEKNVRTYDGGALTLYAIDRGEPAAGAWSVAIVVVDERQLDEMGAIFTCGVVGNLMSLDFAAQRVGRLSSGHNIVSIPARVMADEPLEEAFNLILKSDREGRLEAFRAKPTR